MGICFVFSTWLCNMWFIKNFRYKPTEFPLPKPWHQDPTAPRCDVDRAFRRFCISWRRTFPHRCREAKPCRSPCPQNGRDIWARPGRWRLQWAAFPNGVTNDPGAKMLMHQQNIRTTWRPQSKDSAPIRWHPWSSLRVTPSKAKLYHSRRTGQVMRTCQGWSTPTLLSGAYHPARGHFIHMWIPATLAVSCKSRGSMVYVRLHFSIPHMDFSRNGVYTPMWRSEPEKIS